MNRNNAMNNPIFLSFLLAMPIMVYAEKQNCTVIGNQNVCENKAGHDINIQYGIPQKVVDRLLKELDDKDVKLQERDKTITELIRKYKDLERQLANRTDDSAKRASILLADGEFKIADLLNLSVEELMSMEIHTTQK
jgi:hypothetical protein